MAKKKAAAAKASQAALSLQPYYKDNSPPLTDHPQWLNELKDSLSTIQPDRILHLDLTSSLPPSTSPPSPLPRYTFAIVDHNLTPLTPLPSSLPPSCGVLIIARGRELEYLFSHPSGQLSLCKQNSFHRLILVTLNRTHTFTSLQSVQHELRPFIPTLLPPLTPPSSVPFLALSPDLGERREVTTVNTESNGEVVVDDLKLDGEWIRRLLFVKIGSVQAEARLKGGEVNLSYLYCGYQQAFIAAMSLFPTPSSILLIGLGAGSLPMFLSLTLPLAQLTVVELDPTIADFAASHFAFTPTPRMTLHIDDGINFLTSTPHTYDLIIIDCNSSDLSTGFSFPPPSFLTPSSLCRMHEMTSERGGVVLNFGCRDEGRRQGVLKEWSGVWSGVYEVEVDDEDVNTILVGRKEGGEVTRGECKGRVMNRGRVEEERRKAEGEGVEMKPFRWSDEMKLKQRVDAMHRIVKEEEKDGQVRFVTAPLPDGDDQEEDDNTELSADEKKKAKAREKRARQKQKKKIES